MGLAFVNRSHAWLKMAGADVKDAQGQMRHKSHTAVIDRLGIGEIESDRCGAHSGTRPGLPEDQLVR